jgi:type II secretory pathway pseudopilin PulG
MKRAGNNISVQVRQGLTLMELVVVLVILMALAGILLPMLPSLLTKTHDSVTTTNIGEVDKAITGYLNTNLSYPDQFDSIIDSNGNMHAGAVFNPGNPVSSLSFTGSGASTQGSSVAGGGKGTAFTKGTLSTGQVTSLTLGGINNLMVMNAGSGTAAATSPPPWDATFNAYVGLPGVAGATTPVAGAGGTSGAGASVLFADNDYVFQKLNIKPKLDSAGTPCSYVVFGLGPYCTIVGARSFGIFDAPVAFGEHNFEQPSLSYARMLCVFRVYNDGSRCEFVGSAHPDPTGLGTYDMHAQEYYQTTN